MKSRHFDHIDLRVRDLARATKFYVPVLNALGFTVDQKITDWVSYEAPRSGSTMTEFFGFTHDPNHTPNGTRIAFWAETREEVDHVADVARTAGALRIEGPEVYVDSGYYAVFFEDPEGNKLEVCCREAATTADAPKRGAEILLLVALALLAGTIAKLPQFINGISEKFYYPRNISFVVLPALAIYFLWKNRRSRGFATGIVLAFLVAAVFINLLPDHLNKSDSVVLSCIHLPAFLWCILGVAYTGRIGPDGQRWQYLKFNGELLVYTGLLLIGGAALTGLTLGLFSLIKLDIAEWYIRNIVPYGAAAAPIVGAYIVSGQARSRIAPIVAKIFSPLVLITLVAYLLAMAIQHKSPYTDREFLILFNAMLLLVLAIIVFAVSERDATRRIIMGDFIHIAMIVVAVILDAVALSAIVFRLSSYGFTPNRIAVLGANVITLMNLTGLLWHYLRFVRGRVALTAVEQWITNYLSVYAAWTAVVAFAFPFLFQFR